MYVDVIDVGYGNTKSVTSWVNTQKVEARLVGRPENISSNLIILPGVGSVKTYMSEIRTKGFDRAISSHVESGGRVLGICLGFQVLSNYSEEDGGVECLGLINARVEKLRAMETHNGWENFELNTRKIHPESIERTFCLTRKSSISGRVFYNHEYGMRLNGNSEQYSVGISSIMNEYAGFLIKGNVYGCQFHPEKSQRTGVELLSLLL